MTTDEKLNKIQDDITELNHKIIKVAVSIKELVDVIKNHNESIKTIAEIMIKQSHGKEDQS